MAPVEMSESESCVGAYAPLHDNSKKLSLLERYALEPPLRQRPNPLQGASLLSRVTMHWFQPLVTLGARKALEPDDVWAIAPVDSCDALQERFAEHYAAAVATASSSAWVSSRFARALGRTFKKKIAIVFANDVVYVAAMALQPYITQAMLDFINDHTNVFHVSNEYALVAMMTIDSFIAVSAINYGGYLASRTSSSMRSIVMDAVYQKTLRLSCSSRQTFSSGQVMTLMSVDSERIFNCMMTGPWAFISPIAFVATVVLIAVSFDVVTAASAAVVLLLTIFMSFRLAKHIGKVQGELLRVTQERVKVTSETLQGIRVMKFYAWEESLARRVEVIRGREIGLYRRFHFLNAVNSTLLFILPVFMGAATFGVFIAVQGTISVTEAYTLLAMVNISRFAVGLFPQAIASVTQARAAFQRLDSFLESEEIDIRPQDNSVQPGRVVLHEASFSWTTLSSRASATSTSVGDVQSAFTLDGINLDIAPVSLVMIVGAVGAGKTSLLSAILGEMACTSGSFAVGGKISYVSQEAWIRNASVRDNILFQSEFDGERYQQVLDATQLTADLASLPNGDHTEIGERGINLSGGQKARVAIARAMYRDSFDVLILDDPLSAVDPHVAHAIFKDCVVGLAKHKTRLLVLNSHYELLQHADRVVVLEQGRVVGDGSFTDIALQFPSLATDKNKRTEDDMTAVEARPVGDDKRADDNEASGEDKKPAKPNSTLVQAEDRVKGRVTGSTYRAYFDETGFNGIVVALVVSIVYAIAQGLRTAADYWQGHWAKEMTHKNVDPTYSDSFYMYWYVGFVVSCAVLTFVRGVVLVEVCVRSANRLHQELFRRVLRAPVNRYFDVTPLGRILNRFSSDLDQLDSKLPQQYQALFQSMVIFLGSLVVCAFASVWIAASYIPLLVVFVVTGFYFKRTSREIKRLESITRTPIFNLSSETIAGLHTIRAFKMQNEFVRLNKQAIDTNASYYFHFWASGRWLAVRLDWLSVIIIFVVSLYVVNARDSITPVVAGLCISYSLMLTSAVQNCVRSADNTDNAMTSVERLLHFREIPTEDDGEGCMSMDASAWPSNGAIKFDALSLKYRPELPLVLHGVNLEIGGGEKVGICGRTGAGKSSLMSALFRICEFESGTVWIDGYDITKLRLRDLRRSLAIIPQDPVLYSGSVRENLDPFGEYSDDAIWNVLRQAHLATSVHEWGYGLDFVVSENGDNLSVGQRQLVCIARALLKDSKIVVLDEATANVDSATDTLIQTTIREAFRAKTVLTIAHRINTIVHCDKIAVMAGGRVVEVGAPSVLLARPESVFTGLVKATSATRGE